MQNLANLVSGKVKRIKQDNSKASIAPKITREDELIDIYEKGKNIINKIRAFNPYPLAYLKTEKLEFKVLEASFMPKENPTVGKINITKNSLGIEVRDGIIYFDKIKPLGKKEMHIKDYLNGLKR